MPDGAYCDTALTRRCRNGTCLVASPTTVRARPKPYHLASWPLHSTD